MAFEKEASISDTAVASEPASPTQGITRSWSTGSYPKLSELMGSWPDVAIFRRFGSLNAQNLLFLQAELAHLERHLRLMREREEKAEDEKGIMAQRSWYELSQASEDGETLPQWDLIQVIQDKLKAYSKSDMLQRDEGSHSY